jgi:hypothetical protein
MYEVGSFKEMEQIACFPPGTSRREQVQIPKCKVF